MQRTPARSFQDLTVWQKAHQFVLGVYGLTAQFPRHELYGLSAQLRRAAVSVPANIAEGFKKRSRSDKLRYYNIAQGSLEEARYYLILAEDIGYATTRAELDQLVEVSRALDGYMSAIKLDQGQAKSEL